jgi:hypothetical protein
MLHDFSLHVRRNPMTGRRAALKVATLGVVGMFLVGMGAQVNRAPRRYAGLPEDWTHHHIIFTRKGLAERPWLANSEPRVLQQFLRRARPGFNLSRASLSAAGATFTPSQTGRDWRVQLGGGKVTLASAPAKYNFDPTAPPSCADDYVVFVINALGSSTQATVVALNNLYAGGFCSTASPTTYFTYNTSTLTNGRNRTSPVLSLDGKKIAFIESTVGKAGTTVLHVLTYDPNGCSGCSFKKPAIPGVGNNASMVSVTVGNAGDNYSAPWLDYKADTMYVGTDDGMLYKITGVFTTPMPTVVTSGGWPVAIQTSNTGPLSGPVQDKVSGKIFIGDNQGMLDSVDYATPGTVSHLAVGRFRAARNHQIYDAPLVDSLSGTVFALSSNDGNSAVLVEADTTTLFELARINIGIGSVNSTTNTATQVNLYDGNFDNNYINGDPSGYMLVCGTGAADITPYRYHLGFSGSIIQADPSPSQITNSTTARCGPITEFFNPNIGPSGTDYFFWGVTDTCVGASGCIMSLDQNGTVTTLGATGGSSAVIIDNDSTASQASSIYYTNQSNPLYGYKATQNGLQ